MQLNAKQEIAKNHIDGPLLIIAGAGSGKTATLTARVEYMIREKGIVPSSLLCVTFTNKAAREMRERIGKALGTEIGNNPYRNHHLPMIGTFHSIGVVFLKEILARYSSEELGIGLKKDFIIYDETDKVAVLKSIIKEELQLDEKRYPPRQIAFYISNAKNALLSPKEYEQEVDSPIKEVVRDVYYKYEARLTQNNALDFDDILLKVYRLLSHEKILIQYQNRFQYIMVDEYQDTNAPQYHIIRLLAARHRNLAVVGDDWQSIYSWRGADMRNILNFKKDYPEAEVVKLEQNYRSTGTIIEAANEVIKHNTSSLKKELWTDNIAGEKIQYIEAPDDRIEAKVIVEIIKEKVEKNNVIPAEVGIDNGIDSVSSREGQIQQQAGGDYSDNLILYRTNGQSRQLEEALIMKGIPYRVIGGLKFYDRMEIKDMLAYLRVIYNPDDVVSMKRIINTPSRKIGAKTIEVLDQYRDNFGINYPQILGNIEEVEELRSGAIASLKDFSVLYQKLVQLSTEVSVADLLTRIGELTQYEDYLRQNYSKEECDAKLDNLSELENVASEYTGMSPRESLGQFLEEVALITDMDTKDDREDFVTLMTIHTAKGLEYNRVFITGLEEGIFPHIRSINDGNQLEEERRLMYVAMTRAKQELYISRAKERFYFGDYVRNPESRFISEIPLKYKEDYDISSYGGGGSFFSSSQSFGSFSSQIGPIEAPTKMPKPVANNDISQFRVGDRVEHHKFGGGIITEMTGEIASIAFSGIGIKKMNIRIAPVKKV